jgi:C1A family cysteine protease
MRVVASEPAAHSTGLAYPARESQSRLKLRAAGVRIGLSTLVTLALAAAAQAQTQTFQIMGYYTGAKLATADQRQGFPKAAPRRGLTPPKVDLSALMPPIGDQGKQGSCVAWSVAYALRSYYVAKIDKLPLTQPQNLPSPAYVYNHANFDKGVITCRLAGMQVYHALDIMRAGAVSMADLPYDQENCSPAPNVNMQARAKKFRIDAWEFVDPSDIDSVKSQLAAGNPIAFVMALAPSFPNFRGSGVYARPSGENIDTNGAHAMVLIGYDDARKAFLLQNSWSTGWGDKGRAWLAYDTFKSDAYEAYVMHPVVATR